MLKFIKHNYGFKIIHIEDGTIGGITYYDKYNLIGGLFRDYEIREIFENINNVIPKKHQNKPVTLKYIQSMYYSRKGINKSLPIIYSLQDTSTILEKFKYAKQLENNSNIRYNTYGINGASRNDY